MSRNIKEIGKELMGKSLNSFHRKTGLTQLEKNNEMQDGILNGILSQVDDAYIEKTEQSNVIHLEGSGDGVVVLDGIEGNTMVNMVKSYDSSNFLYVESQKLDNQYFKLQHSANENSSSVRVKYGNHIYKPNTTYTLVVDIKENTANVRLGVSGINSVITKFSSVNFSNLLGQSMITFVTKDDFSTDARGENPPTLDLYFCSWDKGGDLSKHITFRYWILEGDWTNKEIPPYFEGLQSSFEEKVNDQGKYEIEILSQNKNIVNIKDAFTCVIDNWSTNTLNNHNPISGTVNIGDNTLTVSGNTSYHYLTFPVDLKKGVTYYLNYNCNQSLGSAISFFTDLNTTRVETKNAGNGTFVLKQDCKYIGFPLNDNISSYTLSNLYININENYGYIEPKQNKIKLLLDEPLRSVRDVKDELCVKNGKLVVKRNIIQKYYNGTQGEFKKGWTTVEDLLAVDLLDLQNKTTKDFSQNIICDRFATNGNSNTEGCYKYYSDTSLLSIPVVVINKNKLVTPDIEGFKVWLRNNPINVVCVLEEPIYEEVLNEYGEPILLEGYENGTIYIDSTIVPTTTVKYTPKMESFKTLKEVNNNNIMLTNDVNDNIIPYMMDVDLMIMEKEMALMSHTYKLRRIGAKDMTSMQKRTQDMLTRLIKGKTLTEQECKTRVVTYLDAGKITDAQADELMLLISEVYA